MNIRHKKSTGSILLSASILVGCIVIYLSQFTAAPWPWLMFSCISLGVVVFPGGIIGGVMILMAGINEGKRLKEVGL